jgi:hypothetical protein
MMNERSMLSQIILTLVEQTVAGSAHDYGHSGEGKLPLTRRHKYPTLSPIPRNITALLATNELMAGAQIE